MLKLLVLIGALAGLSACVSQSEMALANNVYKLDVDARGLIAMSEAKRTLQERAAKLTLSKGFTHYLIADANTAEGATYLGTTPTYGQTSVNFIGRSAYGQTTVYGGQPIIQPRSSTSLIVVMFREPDVPPNAIDARLIATGN